MKYRRKPLTIDNIYRWVKPQQWGDQYPMPDPRPEFNKSVMWQQEGIALVNTAHGWIPIQDGDYIVPEWDGETYFACNPKIFDSLYEECNQETEYRLRDEVQKAHDLLMGAFTTESKHRGEIFPKTLELALARGASDALCWVLMHDNPNFRRLYEAILKRITDAGYTFEKDPHEVASEEEIISPYNPDLKNPNIN